MAEGRFWALVEESGGDADGLKQLLMRLPGEDIIAFDLRLDEAMYQLDREDIHEVTDGSDDGFEYVRLWIVSRGKAYFESVLADPRNAPHWAGSDEENESFGYTAIEAYEALFGDDAWEIASANYLPHKRWSCTNIAAWPSLYGNT
jgi:hypothetical protein